MEGLSWATIFLTFGVGWDVFAGDEWGIRIRLCASPLTLDATRTWTRVKQHVYAIVLLLDAHSSLSAALALCIVLLAGFCIFTGTYFEGLPLTLYLCLASIMLMRDRSLAVCFSMTG